MPGRLARAEYGQALDSLNPERLYRIQQGFRRDATASWQRQLAGRQCRSRRASRRQLDLINELFPQPPLRLSTQRRAGRRLLLELLQLDEELPRPRPRSPRKRRGLLSRTSPMASTAATSAATENSTTGSTPRSTRRVRTTPRPSSAGKSIPMITHAWGSGTSCRACTATGMIGMVDYISGAGYYGLIPMFPYQYARRQRLQLDPQHGDQQLDRRTQAAAQGVGRLHGGQPQRQALQPCRPDEPRPRLARVHTARFRTPR